jgi:hypothetical protein
MQGTPTRVVGDAEQAGTALRGKALNPQLELVVAPVQESASTDSLSTDCPACPRGVSSQSGPE